MGAVRSKLMTAEEFWRLPDDGRWRSLIRGEVIEEMPPGGLHGVVASKIVVRLHTWAEKGPRGHVGVESGFILGRNPDVVRGPDVFYVGPDRTPHAGVPEPFWDIAPDLAVGVVYPRTREVVVHTPDGLARTYGEESVLEGVELLPGSRCAVSELFG